MDPPLGPPWPKHGCFDNRDIGKSTLAFDDAEEGVLGIVIETEVHDPGRSGKIVVRCFDGTIADGVYDTSWDLVRLVGRLVLVIVRDGHTTLRLVRVTI